jgi:plastocyanin
MVDHVTLRPHGWIILTFLAGCGSASGTIAAQTSGTPVMATTVNATPELAFTPATANVLPGGTVTFDFGGVPHNVFFDPAPGAPADIPGNNSAARVTRTFASAGTYNYNCHIHPGMRGTVVVGTSSSTGSVGGNYYP